MSKAHAARESGKGFATPAGITRTNLNEAEPTALTPMNFKVPETFHREFKLFAVQHGMTMVDLLQQSFLVLKKSRGH